MYKNKVFFGPANPSLAQADNNMEIDRLYNSYAELKTELAAKDGSARPRLHRCLPKRLPRASLSPNVSRKTARKDGKQTSWSDDDGTRGWWKELNEDSQLLESFLKLIVRCRLTRLLMRYLRRLRRACDEYILLEIGLINSRRPCKKAANVVFATRPRVFSERGFLSRQKGPERTSQSQIPLIS